MPADISLSNQADVDDFVINFGTCIIITGNLTIENTDITNVDGLQNLTTIGGTLDFRRNDNLTNVDGLQNLTSVDGVLFINSNPQLSEFCGLNTLLNQPNNGGATSVNISSNASNPTAMEIRNGSPCARVLPEPEPQNLPAIPLPFLAILGLVILSISLGSLKLR